MTAPPRPRYHPTPMRPSARLLMARLDEIDELLEPEVFRALGEQEQLALWAEIKEVVVGLLDDEDNEEATP